MVEMGMALRLNTRRLNSHVEASFTTKVECLLHHYTQMHTQLQTVSTTSHNLMIQLSTYPLSPWILIVMTHHQHRVGLYFCWESYLSKEIVFSSIFMSRQLNVLPSPKSLSITFHGLSANCPEGYDTVAQNLDGSGKKWAQPHPDGHRTLQQCADICNDRIGCTSFEYANGPQAHGACGTYTGGSSNIKKNENRERAGSKWFSCIKSKILSNNQIFQR